MRGDDSKNDLTDRTFVEGVDFYFDEGLMVLTKKYLLDRGYCCENMCRNCPYGNGTQAAHSK